MKPVHFSLLIGSGWVLSLVCSIAVIMVSFECRILADQLMQLRVEEQQLQVDWGRLLLEESALAAHARVEERAQQELGMRRPLPNEIRVVGR